MSYIVKSVFMVFVGIAVYLASGMPAAAKGMFYYDANLREPFYTNPIADQFIASGDVLSLDMNALVPVAFPAMPPIHSPEDYGFYTYDLFMSGIETTLPDYTWPDMVGWSMDTNGLSNIMDIGPAGDGSHAGQHEVFWGMTGYNSSTLEFSSATLAVMTLNVDVPMASVPLRVGQISNIELDLGEGFSINTASYFNGQGDTLDYEVFTRREWMSGMTNGDGEYLPDWLTYDSNTGVITGTWPSWSWQYTEVYYPLQVFVRATRDGTGYSAVQSFYIIPKPALSEWEVENEYVANEDFGVYLADYFLSDEGATYGFEFDENQLPPECTFYEPDYFEGMFSYGITLSYPVTAHSLYGTMTTTNAGANIYDPVTVINPVDNITVVADDTVAIDLEIVFQRPYPDCQLSYDAFQTGTGDPLPAWLVFNDPWEPTMLEGVVTQADIDGGTWPLEVTIEAFDCASNSDATMFSIDTASGAEEPPVFVGPVPDQVATVDTSFSFDVSPYFTGDNLAFSLDDPSNPVWLSISPGSSIVTGTPTSGDTGAVTVLVAAANGSGTEEGTFLLTVSAADVPPSFDMVIPAQEAEVGSLFSLDVSTYVSGTNPAFSYTTNDVATGDPIANPTWLSMTAGGLLSGTPGSGDVGQIEIEVEAQNTQGSVTQAFVMDVVPEGAGEGGGGTGGSVLDGNARFIIRGRLPVD